MNIERKPVTAMIMMVVGQMYAKQMGLKFLTYKQRKQVIEKYLPIALKNN